MFIVAIPKEKNTNVYEWIAVVETEDAAATYAIKFEDAIIIDIEDTLAFKEKTSESEYIDEDGCDTRLGEDKDAYYDFWGGNNDD